MSQIFYRGEEALNLGKQEDAAAAVRREQLKHRIDEFYLNKDGDEAELLILDDDATSYYRHTLPNGKGGYDSFTCLTERGNCPLCAAGKAKAYVTLFTVIDLTRIIQSNKTVGKVYKYKKYVLAVRSDERNRLNQLRKDNGGTLKFARIRFVRASGSKKSLGESIDFRGRVNMDWIKTKLAPALAKALPAYAGQDGVAPTVKDHLTPVDYTLAYPVLSPEKLASVAGVPYKGGSSKASQAMTDDLGLDGLDDLGDTGGGIGASDDFDLDSGFEGTGNKQAPVADDDDLGLGL